MNNILKQYEKIAHETPYLKKEDEFELIKNVKEKDCADSKERIIRSYMRTAVSLAKKYSHRNNLEVEDLIGVGLLGISRAIENFDMTKYKKINKTGGSLLGYFIYRGALMALSDHYRQNIRQFSVSDPTNVRLNNINKLYKKGLLNDLSPEETINFISEKLGIKKREVSLLITLFKKPVELDCEIEHEDSDKGTAEYKDLILKTHEKDTPRSIMEQNDRKTCLIEAINNLPPDEFNLICHRYGIYSDDPKTLAETGQKYKMSGQNVKNKIDKIQRNLKEMLKAKI